MTKPIHAVSKQQRCRSACPTATPNFFSFSNSLFSLRRFDRVRMADFCPIDLKAKTRSRPLFQHHFDQVLWLIAISNEKKKHKNPKSGQKTAKIPANPENFSSQKWQWLPCIELCRWPIETSWMINGTVQLEIWMYVFSATTVHYSGIWYRICSMQSAKG